MPAISVTKKICHIPNPIFAKDAITQVEAIDLIKIEGTPLVAEEEIEIFKNINVFRVASLHRDFLGVSGELSFAIEPHEIVRIANDIAELLRSTDRVARHLQSLDSELGRRMSEDEIEFSEDDLPQYLIAGKCSFLPGPKPEGYHFRKKNYLLDKLLLEREMAQGINSEGYNAEFKGFVPFIAANFFVLDGHLFSENEQVDNNLIHGKYSHRLSFEIFREAVKNDDLNLKLKSGHELNTRELLEFLIKIKMGNSPKQNFSLWTYLIDSADDSVFIKPRGREIDLGANHPDLFDHHNYSYSSRNPATLKAILTCFGRELQLPNLQHYLLDSHWKQVNKITQRVLLNDITGILDDMPAADLATNCLKVIMCNGLDPTTFAPSPITLRMEDISDSARQPFSEKYDAGIVVKTSKLSAQRLVTISNARSPDATSRQTSGGGGSR